MLNQAIIDVKNGKYVDVEISTAYEIILQTQSLGSDWNLFLQEAVNAVLHAKFNPCVCLKSLRDYVCREMDMQTNESENLPLSEKISAIFDSAMIYLQRYDIQVSGAKGKIFIYRTPTERDFDRARATVIFVLELFRQAAKGDIYKAVNPPSDITMTIRGQEKFFDINIKSEINGEAWVGFDFR